MSSMFNSANVQDAKFIGKMLLVSEVKGIYPQWLGVTSCMRIEYSPLHQPVKIKLVELRCIAPVSYTP